MSAPHRLDRLVHLDSECRRLIRVQAVAELRFGQVCRALRRPLGQGSVFHALGNSHFKDFAREKLGVCVRTATRAIELASALERFERVRRAYLEGAIEAGKVLVLARYLVRHADEEAVRVEQAGRLSLRALREELGQKAESEDVHTRTYQFTGPEYRVVANAIELCSAMHGSELSCSQAVELIVADVLAGIPVPDVEVHLPSRRCHSAEREEELEQIWRGWDFLGDRLDPIELLESPLPNTPRELLAEARALLRTSRCWQLALGQLLAELEQTRMVAFANVGHYAEERLGMSRSQAYALVQREHRMRQTPLLRLAVEQGRLTVCQADILWPALERGVRLQPWVKFARRTTCKVLKRWVTYLLGLSRADFETWVKRAPRQAQLPRACPGWLRRLEVPVAGRDTSASLDALELSLRLVQTLSIEVKPEDVRPFRVTLEADALRTVMLGELAVAYAVGEVVSREHCLMLLSETFVVANRDQHGLKGRQKRLMLRDNCTCCAPGCTSRHNLQAHHIVFRSHGGSNEDENQIMLCVACHLRLVHEGYLKVSGTANELVFESAGERYVNEMRVTGLGARARRPQSVP